MDKHELLFLWIYYYGVILLCTSPSPLVPAPLPDYRSMNKPDYPCGEFFFIILLFQMKPQPKLCGEYVTGIHL